MTEEKRHLSDSVLAQEAKGENIIRYKKERQGFAAGFTKKERILTEIIVSQTAVESDVDSKFKALAASYDSLLQNSLKLKGLVTESAEVEEIDSYLVEFQKRLTEMQSNMSVRKETKKQSSVVGDIKPEDSLSQAGTSSSLSSSLAKLAAKKASLQIRAANIKKAQQLQIKQLEIQHLQESLEMETELEAAKAEESVYNEMTRHPVTPIMLNPKAKEWPVGESEMRQPVSASAAVDLSSNNNKSEDILSLLQLPKTEIHAFDGDPLRYWIFVRSFDNCVGETSLSDSGKLNRLLQYCTGRALEVVECCAVMDPSRGYIEARKLLYERFGNEHVIAKAWINRVTTGPTIKFNDRVNLRKYADDVRNCHITLEATGCVNEIDNQARMKKIVERLPLHLQNRWRSEAVRTLKQHGRYPDIAVLVDFIQTVSEEADDPVFGIDSLTVTQRSSGRLQPMKSSSNFNIQVQDHQWNYGIGGKGPPQRLPPCKYCNDANHAIFKCKLFTALNPDKRLEYTRTKKLCYNCFSGQHQSYNCPRDSKCGKDGCRKKHSWLIHPSLSIQSKQQDKSVRDFDTKPSEQTNIPSKHSTVSNAIDASRTKVALPIVPVKVRGNGNQEFIQASALLDPGSTNTFCSQALANKLGLVGTETPLFLTTLTSDNCQSHAKLASFEVADVSGSHTMMMHNAFVISQLPDLRSSLVTVSELSEWPHLNGITIPSGSDMNIDILVGQDNPSALIPLDVKVGKPDEPYATRTVFGWAVNGPVGSQQTSKDKVFSNCVQGELHSLVERLWKLDSYESQIDETVQMSDEDKAVLDLWTSTVQREQGHYKLPIPFKSEKINLPNNVTVAESRLESLKRKLSRDSELHEKYKTEIDGLIQKGYAEKVPDEEVNSVQGPVWYLPHHAVVSEKKPGKVRIVFDCSSKYNGVSLNTQVFPGPDLTNSLIGVLVRFRQGPVAVAGDIEAMFHQIKVLDEHRNVLRFLWWKEGDFTNPVDVFRMTSHLFGGAWCSSIANFAVKRTAKENSQDFDPEVVLTVEENMYVDDCLKSVSSEESAIHVIKDVCELLGRGGFKITKWSSNRKRVIDSVPVEMRSKNLRDLDLHYSTLPPETTLGVRWNMETDEFGFKLNVKPKPFTKRGLISVIGSVYDPLGFLCPVVLQAKIIFQDECRLRKGWDDPLEEAHMDRWLRWLKSLPHVEKFATDRCFVPHDFGNILQCELHHFCDASMVGYGVVSYLRLVNEDGRIHCGFLLGKSRLAPIREITIPRLELSAAVQAVKQNLTLTREFKLTFDKITFWTDSTVVLHYINNDSQRYQTFVANRITKIRDGSSPEEWRHVDSVANPSDVASRGSDPEQLPLNSSWNCGPEFLWKDESEWPEIPEALSVSEAVLEIKRVKANLTVSKEFNQEVFGLDKLLQYYSSWKSLKKAVAWMLRFRCLLRQRVSKRDSSHVTLSGLLTVSEMDSAEKEIVKYVQQSCFCEEIKCLLRTVPVKKSSHILSLDPVLDESEILCVGGRLKNTPLSWNSKHPILLPKSHHVTNLIVRHHHQETGHSGREYVLAEIRQKFWIISGRSVVRQVLRDCVQCKRLSAQPLQQKMAALPKDRVTPGKPPFTYVGVDCFGPFEVKRGRSRVKRYGCLFTCLCTRAVHIEKLETLDTDSFINALRRFICRRGRPELIRSDNGTNFRGGERELRIAIQQWNQAQIHDYLLQKEIQWKFNPPTASHMGGAWERQIKTVRKVLNSICHGQTLNDEGLDTLFCEAESIVNGRPITVVSSSCRDAEPLTPNHLLQMRSGHPMPPGEFHLQDIYRRRWRHIQFLADMFWKRWLREYLPTLQIKPKWLKSVPNLSVNDIVLIMDTSVPRNMWPLGRVTKVFPGQDGLIRSVEVKTRNSLLLRPIHKLCLLESCQ